MFTRFQRPFACLSLALTLAACGTIPSTGDQPKTFTNAAYGFSFMYPGAYQETVYGPQAITIGTMSGDVMMGRAEVETVLSSLTAQETDYDAFVLTALRNTCAADGPDASFSCTDLISRESVKTPSGLSADEYFLKSEETPTGSGETLTGERGPFIVFNIAANLDTPGFAILVIRPSTNVPEEDIDEALLRSIRDSLVMNKVEFRGSVGSVTVTSAARSSSEPSTLTAQEGEMCGGIAAIPCADGLTCSMAGNYPDASGTCVKESSASAVLP